MTNLLERYLGVCRIAAGLLLLPVLVACGPGVGGTGTGSPELSGVDTQVYEGETNCGVQCQGVELVLEPQSVQLLTPCSLFLSQGRWAIDSEGSVTLAGRFENFATGSAVAASLQLQFSSPSTDSQQAQATLVDESGAILIGQTTLARTQEATPPAGQGTCH